MRIETITYQRRRDFSAVYKCEGCGARQTSHAGYDDEYYHQNVIPNMKCPKCLKSTNDLGTEILNTKTKYKQNEII